MTQDATKDSAAARSGDRASLAIADLLRQMHDAVAREASAQDRLDHLTHTIAAHVGADVCSIYLRQTDDALMLFATEGLNRDAVRRARLPMGEGLVGQVAQSRRPLATPDAPRHEGFRYLPEVGEDPLRAFLGVPLIRSGKTLGVLVVQHREARMYRDVEIEAVQAVAALLAEIAASGELLTTEETAAVGEMLHRPEQLKGAAVVSGVAIGRALFLEPPAPKHKVFAADVVVEADRLDAALAALRRSVDAMLDEKSSLAGESRDVLEAYRLFAYDRGWGDRLRAAIHSGLTAEAAVDQVKNENRQRLMQSRDAYLRERLHDLDDLSHRLMRLLAGDQNSGRRALDHDTILLARAMGPAELLEYHSSRLKGLVLGEVSATAHVAIVARALKIPMVTGMREAMERAEEGDVVIIDGDAGEAFIRPTPTTLSTYEARRAFQSERQAAFYEERALETVTTDGRRIEVMINAGLTLDMAHLEETGAAGVGLFRTELQFLIGAGLPSVADQEAFYAEVMDLADGRPVVFRTADIGGDKTAVYMDPLDEANPAMGWRGLRMALDRPGMVRPQLRALIRAARGRELRIMFPMVTLASELDAARALVERERGRAARAGGETPSRILVGAMIETPAAAWSCAEIATKVDFLSVGGNDLAQFFFAADRDSERVQRRFDPLNAGFLRFLRETASAADRVGAPFSYCGEQAGDPAMAAALIGVGLRSFSLPAPNVGPFRRMIRGLDASLLSRWLNDRIAEGGESLRAPFTQFLRDQGAQFA